MSGEWSIVRAPGESGQQATRLRIRPREINGDFQLRVFTCLLAVGEVEMVDFATLHLHDFFTVGFFDVRHAIKAANELPHTHPDLFAEISADASSSPCRCVKVETCNSTPMDMVTARLSMFGSIERVGYGADRVSVRREIVVEFSDSRACEAACRAGEAGFGTERENRSPGQGVTGGRGGGGGGSGFGTGGGMFEIDSEAIRSGRDTRTTCMLRNIPNKYSQRMLLKLIDAEGFADTFDFFYLPSDLRQKANCGFAFISFVTPDTVIRFVEIFDNKRWDKFNSSKICKVTFARLQGKHMLMEHFRSSSIMQQGKHVRPYFRDDLGPALAPSLLEELNNWLNAQTHSDCESAFFSETSSNGFASLSPFVPHASPSSWVAGPPPGLSLDPF